MQYAIMYRPGPAWDRSKLPDQQQLNGHIAYVQELRSQHKLVQDCPFLGTLKVTVVEVSTSAEARAIAAADPTVVGRVMQATITSWDAVFGLNANNCLPTKI